MAPTLDPARGKALQDYRLKLLEHKEIESKLKERKSIVHRVFFTTKSFNFADTNFFQFSNDKFVELQKKAARGSINQKPC